MNVVWEGRAVHPWPEVAALQASAAEGFRAEGFPGRKHEAWKYTSVLALEKTDLAETAAAPEVGLHTGASVGLASWADAAHRAAARAHLGRLATLAGAPLTALNTACFGDALCIHVPRGVRIEAPIEVRWVGASGGDVQYPRVLIVAENYSDFSVIEHFDGLGDGLGLTNAVTEIAVGEGATVRYSRVQADRPGAWQIGRVAVEVGRDATFHGGLLNLGAALSRIELDVTLVGTGAEARLHGLFAGTGAQHLDQHITVTHQSPRATSYQDFRGILGPGARGVFTGRVNVTPGAHHTRAEQQNRNLLLDPTAHVDTRPQLEILNDDVQCSHGATIGRLDETALFYLRARGIDLPEARRLLTTAFAAPILEALADEGVQTLARTWLERVAPPTGAPA